jgi:hypothetical protein
LAAFAKQSSIAPTIDPIRLIELSKSARQFDWQNMEDGSVGDI